MNQLQGLAIAVLGLVLLAGPAFGAAPAPQSEAEAVAIAQLAAPAPPGIVIAQRSRLNDLIRDTLRKQKELCRKGYSYHYSAKVCYSIKRAGCPGYCRKVQGARGCYWVFGQPRPKPCTGNGQTPPR